MRSDSGTGESVKRLWRIIFNGLTVTSLVLFTGATMLSIVGAVLPGIRPFSSEPGVHWGIGWNGSGASVVRYALLHSAPRNGVVRSELWVSPRSYASVSFGEICGFAAVLPAARLTWTSDRDRVIGTGRHIKTRKPLSRGQHIITLTATNSQGKVGTKKVKVVVR